MKGEKESKRERETEHEMKIDGRMSVKIQRRNEYKKKKKH